MLFSVIMLARGEGAGGWVCKIE